MSSLSSSSSSSSSSSPSPVTVSRENAVFFLTVPLEFSALLDDRTLARLRHALQANLDAHFASRGSNQFLLEPGTMPPKPILTAGFAVRMRWSDWFAALSPQGTPILLHVTANDAPRMPQRPASPAPSLGRSSSCSSMRSDVPSLTSVSTAASSSAASACSSPHSPAPAPHVDIYGVTVDPADPAATLVRRPRRQRGGVKQKQRGIHIDKSKLDITAYDGGVTGVLTGGVMLGRRLRPAAPPIA